MFQGTCSSRGASRSVEKKVRPAAAVIASRLIAADSGSFEKWREPPHHESMSRLVCPGRHDRKQARLVAAGLTAFVLLSGGGQAFGVEQERSGRPQFTLTLEDSILLALANNRSLVDARINREAERFALQVAENKFVPHLNVGSFVDRTNPGTADGRSTVGGISSTLTLRVPTGGALTLGWIGGEKHHAPADARYASELALTFTQPLLRGAGIDVSTASVTIAQVSERINILALRSIVIDIVSTVIRRYRDYLQAERRVEITRKSLERAQALLEVNKSLVRTGRMAERDVVQTQANIASRKLNLIAEQNRLDASRLSLIDVLDIDSRARLSLVDALNTEQERPDMTDSVKVARRHRPDYLIAKLGLENAETRALVAENNRLWDLSASLQANFGHGSESFGDALGSLDKTDYGLRLDLSIPIGAANDPRELAHVEASTRLRRARNNLEELVQRVDIEVENAVREVDLSYRQVGLARAARELVEQKVEVEKEKLHLGLSSNFQLVVFEDDVVDAQNRELDAIINYLNALTSLDSTLGTTLRSWGIRVEGAGQGDDP